MERVIDRKEYRRNNEDAKVISDEQVDFWQKVIRKILFQSLAVSAILLVISFLKFYNCTDILGKIDNALDSEITASSLQKSGQIIFDKATNYYSKLNTFVEQTMQGKLAFNSFLFSSGDISDSSGENTYLSGDVEQLKDIASSLMIENNSGESYESAVEGINQMSEDAKYIKENYKMIVPVIGTITSRFGVRNSSNPIVSSYHSGLDIAANTGTQILASLDGEVIEATTDTYFGKYIKIKKDDIVMTYAHCSKLLVKVGDKVSKGQLIAYVGNTGNSTGPHLHFELKYNDRLVNPTDILDF